MGIPWTVERYRKARAGWTWVGCWGISRGYPGRAYVGLAEIVLEAARDSSFLDHCFGFLMGQGHILKEASHHAHQGGAFVR